MWDMNSSLTVEKERVMCLGTFYQPLHSTQNIGLRREPSGIPSVVRQDNDIFWFKIPVFCRVDRVSCNSGGRISRTY